MASARKRGAGEFSASLDLEEPDASPRGRVGIPALQRDAVSAVCVSATPPAYQRFDTSAFVAMENYSPGQADGCVA